MRRFLLVLAGLTAVLATSGVPAVAATATAASCVSAAQAEYRRTFDGAAGKVTIRAERALCSGQKQAFSLISYTAGAPGTASGQFVYDSAGATITSSRRSVTLDVAVPACFFQVNAIKGTGVRTETTSNTSPYGAANLLDWYAGGSTACTATPTVTFANACDGTFTATLANGRSANAQAIFVVGERRIRLPAGGSTKLRGGKNSTLTIRASNFTTYVGTWGLPDGPCAAPTQPAPTRVASPAAAVPTQGAVTPGPTTTSSAPASGSGGGIVDEAAYGTGPDGTAPASATPVAQATSGMGAGGVLVIVLGLLMIGGGLIVLTKVIRSIRST